MKKNAFRYLTVACVIATVSCNRVYYDSTYKGEDNYNGFYLVDTISIDNPVRISSQKYGGFFIVSKEKLSDFKDDIDFYLSPDVFLLGQDLYRDLKLEYFKRYSYPDYGGCELEPSKYEVSGVEIYEYKSTPKFILGLINVNQYHVNHNSEVYFNLPIRQSKSVYYKMVYPLCK